MAQGRFIVLEGIDGAGTTTQVHRLTEVLIKRGHDVVATHEPTNGRLGQACREALSANPAPPPHAMALAFSADRFDHQMRIIEPALSRGAWVLCDRYLLSTLAYQGLKLPIEWLLTLNEAVRRPDLTCLLALPNAVAAERRARRGGPVELYDAEKTQQAVAAAYLALAQSSHPIGPIQTVDAAADEPEVTRLVVELLVQKGWLDSTDEVCV